MRGGGKISKVVRQIQPSGQIFVGSFPLGHPPCKDLASFCANAVPIGIGYFFGLGISFWTGIYCSPDKLIAIKLPYKQQYPNLLLGGSSLMNSDNFFVIFLIIFTLVMSYSTLASLSLFFIFIARLSRLIKQKRFWVIITFPLIEWVTIGVFIELL